MVSFLYIPVALIAASYPVQDHGREPNSDDELLLMGEVESLQSQLKKTGETFNEKIENMFKKSLEDKPLPDRIRKWTIRRDQLRNMAEPPHATSGGPAVSLDDAGTRLKADQPVAVVNEEEKVVVKQKREEGERQPNKKRSQNFVISRHIPIKNTRMGGRWKCRSFTSTLPASASSIFAENQKR